MTLNLSTLMLDPFSPPDKCAISKPHQNNNPALSNLKCASIFSLIPFFFLPSMPLIFFRRTVLFREPRAPLADQRLMKLSGEPVSAQPAFYQAPIRCECRRCVSRPLQVGITQRPSAPLPVCPSSNSSHQLPTTGLEKPSPHTQNACVRGTRQAVICCSGSVAQVTHSCSADREEFEKVQHFASAYHTFLLLWHYGLFFCLY